MTDANDSSAHGGAFAKVFLPGLVLGLVVGGVGGAFLPDYVNRASQRVPMTTGNGNAPEGIEIPETVREGAEDATDSIEDAAQSAGETIEDAAEDTGEAIDDAVDDLEDAAEDAGLPVPPSDG